MDDEPQPNTDRRSRELARRNARHRRMNVLGTIVTLGVVTVVALVATDTLRLGGTGPTLASGKTSAPTSTLASKGDSGVAKLTRNKPPRPLSNAAPLRLWIGGDSLSGELGFQIGPMVAKTGIVRAHVDYKISSGLSSNNVRDWPARFYQEQQQYNPEAVIFMIGANDAPIVGSAVDASGTPLWETKYRVQVQHMMDLLVGASAQRTVFWVGSPTLGTRYNHGAEEIDQVMREEAAKRPTVVYVDAFSLFAVNGQFSSSLPDASGERVQMRVGDGVHFTVKGAEYLAQHVYSLLDKRWDLTTQAEPDHTIPYTIEPSSGSVGGVHIGNGNSGSSGSSSGSGTTAPTTAAPVTTAPKSTTTVPHTSTTAPHTTTSGPGNTSPPAT